jgi:phage-related protein
MRSRPARNEKPLYWVASSKRDLLRFPAEVVSNVGYALGAVQLGAHPSSAKPWKGLGPAVLEIVEDGAAGTFRTVYTVGFRRAVYVLHAFQKKSPSGIRTAQHDVDLIGERLKAAKRDYEARYGKEAD